MKILKKFFYWPIAICQMPMILYLMYEELKAIRGELRGIRETLEPKKK